MGSFKRSPAARAGDVLPPTIGTVHTFEAAERAAAEMREAAEPLAAGER